MPGEDTVTVCSAGVKSWHYHRKGNSGNSVSMMSYWSLFADCPLTRTPWYTRPVNWSSCMRRQESARRGYLSNWPPHGRAFRLASTSSFCASFWPIMIRICLASTGHLYVISLTVRATICLLEQHVYSCSSAARSWDCLVLYLQT